MANDILMYRTINNDMYKELNIDYIDMDFSYFKDGENIPIELKGQKDNENVHEFYMGNSDSFWDVSNDNLNIKRTLKIGNSNILFGNRGITTIEGKLGIAAHIYSRSSNFQTTVNLDETITKDSTSEIISFNHIFESGEIKGDIYFSIFVYLKNEIKNVPMFANIPGIRLGEIDRFKITVDGDGSVFPIVEVEKEGQPLWSVSMDWTDINDTFDNNNVRIEINNKHHMYNYLYKSTKPSNYLLVEILSNAIAQIILKVVEDDDFEYEEESIPDSIRSVVVYWMDTYEVDISSLEMINYSLRKNIESLFII